MPEKIPHLERTKVPHVTLVANRHGATHLIMPLVKRLAPLPVVEAEKLWSLHHEPKGPVAIFWRDPRNRLTSFYRWSMRRNPKKTARLGMNADAVIATMIAAVGRQRMPELEGLCFLEAQLRFCRHWAQHPGTLVTYFEDLTSTSADVRVFAAIRLGNHIQATSDAARMLGSIVNAGKTYTGKLSDWREFFGPKSIEAWNANHGPELLEVMGYKE